MRLINNIFSEKISTLPIDEFERRTFSLKRFLKNEYIQ